MNIFVLDEDPKVAASMMCNKHVVKMILESGQLLCTAHWLSWLDGESGRPVLSDFKRVKDAQEWLKNYVPEQHQPPWKMSHVRHPCTIWAGETMGNYLWLLDHMKGLLKEYTNRYKKIHKSESVWRWLFQNDPMIKNNFSLKKTPHPLCVPEEIKAVTNDPVHAYRTYYVTHKAYMAKWEPRAITPDWWPKEKKDA
jgi:hypothetical protein